MKLGRIRRNKQMRLIDADKLRHELIMGHDLIGAKYTDMADTVEAIPIEWIEEWGWKNGMSESMSLRVMIDDWEKENATN